MTKSLRFKLLALFLVLLALSLFGVVVFTSNLIEENGTKNFDKSLRRTAKSLDNLLKSKENVLKQQVRLVGELPILQTILENGDSATILDSLKKYQTQLQISEWIALDEEGDLITSSANGKSLLAQVRTTIHNFDSKLESYEIFSARVVANNTLYSLGLGPVGILEDEEIYGYIIFANALDDSFINDFKENTGASLSVFSKEGKGLKVGYDSKGIEFDQITTNERIQSVESGENLLLPQPTVGSDGEIIAWFLLQKSLKPTKALVHDFTSLLSRLGMAIFLFAAIVTALFATRLIRPLQELVQATKTLSNGNFDVTLPPMPKDEIGQLASDFLLMVEAIQKSYSDLNDLNAGLEKRVEERTKSIKNLMDNAGQGFLSFNRDFIIQEEFSKECIRMFGDEISHGKDVTELLFAEELEKQEFKSWLINAFDVNIAMDVIAQLAPERIQKGQRIFGLEYKLILDENGQTEPTIMLVLTDLTEKIALEQLIHKEQSQARMILRVLSNRQIFLQFNNDIKNVLKTTPDSISKFNEEEYKEYFRVVHTLKGTASMLEFLDVAEVIHDFETVLQEGKGSVVDLNRLELIQAQLNKCFHELFRHLQERLNDVIDFEKPTVRLPKELVDNVLPTFKRQLPNVYERWVPYMFQPIRTFLTPYLALSEELANRFEKMIAPLEIEGGGELIDPQKYSSVMDSLVHLFRNALDHGIEDPETREELGKEAEGKIEIKISVKDSRIKIVISDDGRGVDPQVIRKNLIDKGLKSKEEAIQMSQDDLIDAIFLPGFSSSQRITDTSGRGVGMDAVRHSIEAINGSIIVESEVGVGTKFSIDLPFFGLEKHFEERVAVINRVLVVEDDKNAMKFLQLALRDLPIELESAMSAKEALEIYEKSPADLVISDMNLPDMNGIELLKKVKSINPSCQLIFITGSDDEIYFQKALEMGAVDYFIKPIDRDALVESLGMTMSRVKRWKDSITGII